MEIDYQGTTYVALVYIGVDKTDTYDVELLDCHVALDEDGAERAIENAWRIEVARILAEKAARRRGHIRRGQPTRCPSSRRSSVRRPMADAASGSPCTAEAAHRPA